VNCFSLKQATRKYLKRLTEWESVVIAGEVNGLWAKEAGGTL